MKRFYSSDDGGAAARPENTPEGAGDTATAEPGPMGPVSVGDRIMSIDVVRGFALLGILVINMSFFAYPSSVMIDPTGFGGFTGSDFWVWRLSHLLFSQKFMALFSMLFGAGLILMWQRAEATGRRFGPFYYKRVFWLWLIGMIHAYFIWYGDILTAYAICGAVLFLFKRMKPRTLILLGVLVMVIGILPQQGVGYLFGYLRGESEAAQAALDAGETLTSHQESMMEAWSQAQQGIIANEEALKKEMDAHDAGYLGFIKHMAIQTLVMQTSAFFFFIAWRVLGLMMIGAGLLKSGFFSAEKSPRFYLVTSLVGYGIGLPATWLAGSGMIDSGFDIVYYFTTGNTIDHLFSVAVALGHAGLLLWLFKSGVMMACLRRLAAVGRMALTNYLTHSIILAIIFNGYALGYFNELNRTFNVLIIVAIWILQLLVSPIWLKHFRFGPAEWLWRSLTYGKKQPMRVTGKQAA